MNPLVSPYAPLPIWGNSPSDAEIAQAKWEERERWEQYQDELRAGMSYREIVANTARIRGIREALEVSDASVRNMDSTFGAPL